MCVYMCIYIYFLCVCIYIYIFFPLNCPAATTMFFSPPSDPPGVTGSYSKTKRGRWLCNTGPCLTSRPSPEPESAPVTMSMILSLYR